MIVRGVGWYISAFVALIIAGVFIGVAAASFLASLTPLWISIVCSVVAVAFGVVAAVRARSGDTSMQEGAATTAVGDGTANAHQPADAGEPAGAEAPDAAEEPAEAAEPADAAPSGDAE